MFRKAKKYGTKIITLANGSHTNANNITSKFYLQKSKTQKSKIDKHLS